MKETGIIMSGNHPRLILDGTLTMTRRVIIPQPNIHISSAGKVYGNWRVKPSETILWSAYNHLHMITDDMLKHCPYGQVGDLLWVKETLKKDKHGLWLYVADDTMCPKQLSCNEFTQRSVISSLFMPRWASRIPLEITGLRAERLQEITVEDAIAEGCIPELNSRGKTFFPARGMFKELWDSLNAKRGFPWEANHWVWPIGFRLVN